MQNSIIKYLVERYNPHTIIMYGSFSNHTNNKNSDFDVLLISDNVQTQHDGTFIDGIELDAFIYSTNDFEKITNVSKFVQAFDGKIILDDKDFGKKLINDIKLYIKQHSVVAPEEKIHLQEWCYKMLTRTKRRDTEGMFRWHWLLHDSLEIYCNMRDMFYFGPKKTLLWIERNDKEGYELVDKALKTLDEVFLKDWIEWVFK